MSVTQRAAVAILAGLTTTEATTAQAITGGKHEANGCGTQSSCLGQGG